METIDVPRILVVEDSRSISLKLQQCIRDDLGFDCEGAFNLADTKALLENHPGDFYCAVLDLHLPDAPNGEVVDTVLQAGIPSIVFTSGIDGKVRGAILDKGVSDYIIKDGMAVTSLLDTLHRLWRNRNVTVLVCDDSRSFREYAKSVLERRLFTVHAVENGQEALDFIATHPEVTALVADYDMPVMDGLTLVRKLRERRPPDSLTIIGVSSTSSEPLSVWFLKAGANDFLHKPFLSEELVSRVEHNVEMLERLHKLRELDAVRTKFMGFVAHDLRNPLNGIRGFAELMIETGTALEDDQREMLGIIRDAAQGMRSMVDDLLDVSVIQSGRLQIKPGATDLNTLVRERVSMNRFEAKRKNIMLEERLENLGEVTLDAERIAQVVDNLVSNAVKFSTPGTTVTVSLYREECETVVTVCDEGPGIPKEEQAKLFRDYHKGSAAPTGGELSTGYGLVIVNSVIQAHGGHVWVESEPGQGACFGFSLPMDGCTE